MSGKRSRLTLIMFTTAVLGPSGSSGWAQTAGSPAADHPVVIVHGQTFTPRSILARNMGTPEDQTAQFPPHKIIGNLYYVGTRTLSSFLIVTPQGNILINSTYERNVQTIEKSVEQLGFKFSDIKILLGTHAHSDHQEGDALVKQLTGAQTMAMTEDVPALKGMKPGGKEHPIDKTLHDGETVMLGSTTLTAHLTPGHTRGCTTWTMKAQEDGKTYNVVIGCSLRPPDTLTPDMVAEFNHSFPLVRSLATCPLAIILPNTILKKSTRNSKMAPRTPSSTLTAARTRSTSKRPCSTHSWASRGMPHVHRAEA